MANWYRMYAFEYNEERTIRILKRFGIEKYHFVADGNSLALLIEKGLNNYRIEVNSDDNEMVILKKKACRKGQRHIKEYMRPIARFNNDAIFNALKFVSEDNE